MQNTKEINEKEVKETQKQEKQAKNVDEKTLKCGIVMPLADMGDLTAAHWYEVQTLIKEVATDRGFEANMVSSAGDSGVIMNRIIQNLHSNEIVVCDISARNPNVMFELGMRLAFDKPTILIKDDVTPFPFDVSAIEHLVYPRDLRYNKIIRFREELGDKIVGTHKSSNDPNYTTFLKHFGTFNVQTLKEQNVEASDYIIQTLENLQSEMSSIKSLIPRNIDPSTKLAYTSKVIGSINTEKRASELFDSFISEYPEVYRKFLENPVAFIDDFVEDVRNYGLRNNLSIGLQELKKITMNRIAPRSINGVTFK